MKKKIVGFILLGSVLSLGLGTVIFSPKKAVVESEGYTASSLPTTIDLNDTSASNIRSYYSSLNNLSTSERQGTNLLKNLKTILKNGQKYYSYENGTSIWQMYEITDRDWDKSPASSTTYGTYNSSTNKITNYTYGTSSSSSKNNPYIHALYINRDVNNQTTAWDNHNQDQWGINREHVWPKAEGFDSSGAGGARGDPMHLMAGNGYANNIHSNYYYGYVKTSSSYTDCGSKYSNQSGNLRGTSKTLNSGTVFEPQDSDKGDIARAIFYMVARYNYLSGSDSDGIDTNNPNLTLTQNISDWSQSGYTSSTSTQGKLGVLSDLLAWHHADPVDSYEIHRNNLLYTNFTNNRNPFIDFPEWVDYIWGTATYNGSTYQSYSSTPTGYAKPNSDTINGYNSGGATVSVTGVSLNKASTSIQVGGAETLEATVAPATATNQGVTWTTSNSSIATVSNGVVRGVAEGSATITVRTSDGGYTATCSITITAASGGGGGTTATTYDLYSGSLSEGDYVVYYDGKAMKNTVSSNRLTYEDITPVDDSIEDPTDSLIWHIAPSGNYWTIYNDAVSKYAGGNGTKNQAALNSNGSADESLWTASGSSTYEFVNKKNASNSVNANLRNNGTYGFACYSTSTGGALTLYKATEHIIPSSKELESITLDTSDAQTTFNVGETFNHDNLVVTANYDDGSSDILSTGYTVSIPNMSTAGQKTITVSYTEDEVTKTATYTITVNSNPSISWTAPEIDVYSGSILSGSDVNGWAVTYNDGAGHQIVLNYSQLTVKLGGSTISIPHTWVAADDGKTLTASYNSLTTSESLAVKVTQTINSVSMETDASSNTSNLTFTAACGGSGSADDGKTWTITSDAAESNYDSTKGVHYGTGKLAVEYIQLVSNSFTSGTITQVKVNASGASGVTGSISVTVGGNAFGTVQSFNSTAGDKTFTGSLSAGQIIVRIYKASAAVNALYCKSVVVTFTTPGELINIANSNSHIDAQRVAVKFANAFNNAMATTSNCTTNMSSAWSTCSSAYNTFKTEAAALGSFEETYAKNLIKYATAQYSNDSGEACIERMMKTYEICVTKHGKTAFMSELVTLSSPNIIQTGLFNFGSNKNVVLIVTITSASLSLVGFYFFIKQRKNKGIN